MHVQGESLKSYAALLTEASQLPDHQSREDVLIRILSAAFAATIAFAHLDEAAAASWRHVEGAPGSIWAVLLESISFKSNGAVRARVCAGTMENCARNDVTWYEFDCRGQFTTEGATSMYPVVPGSPADLLSRIACNYVPPRQ